MMLLLSGCNGKTTKIVLHTGFAKDEVFRVEHMSCSLPELLVYLSTTQSRYEKVYGKRIWETNLEGVTLEENMRDMVLAQLSQVKAMNLLADQEQVQLNREEEEIINEAAEEFYATLSQEEISVLGVDKDLIRRLYREYALANKVYHYIIKDINPEVSDDEARTITVDHILIKTYYLNENDEKVEYDAAGKRDAYKRAQEVLEKARNGVSFDSLIATYNEDSQSQYSFRKGEMNLGFETTAFNLGKGEISEIVETEYGYHIIKCITTFNQEETDANKVKIVAKKREEVFGQRYTSFAADLTKAVNEDLWEEITLIQGEDIDTSEFFDIYQKHLGNQFEFTWE
ncbi:MAG: peptidylprolyl isomerase [Lachnospiraceae bacterium]|nr:peptidylprolyl isomerase [Lachnospiraceae bacterium]